MWSSVPVLTGLFIAAMFAGIGLPGFSGFIGEFLSLTGAFLYDRPYAIVATFGVIFAAVYMLWPFKKAFAGRASGAVAAMKDMDVRELVVVVPLILLSLFMGIYPKPVLDRIEPAAERAVLNFERKTDYRSPETSLDRRKRLREVEKAEADEARKAAREAEHGEGEK
jgi:NADH-quinone oxidoreductase subunit M